MFGRYLPTVIAHRGFGFDQIVGQLYLGTEGIYGIPTLASATYIFLFVLFGAFLEHAGMISPFNNIALGFVGHARGRPAKVAVISSGMMGMISGSGVANVLTVGRFTIPLMKRFGKFGIWPIIIMIGLLVAANFVIKGGRRSRSCVAASALIIGVLTLTGGASNFAAFVLDVRSKSVFLSLFLP